MGSDLSHDIQVWKAQIQALEPFLRSVDSGQGWPQKAALQQALQNIAGNFEAHLGTLEQEAFFIFASRGDDHTRDTVNLLRRWHLAGNAPSLPALCVFAFHHFDLKLPQELVQALLTAGILGEIENNLPYHNNMHYRKVLLQLIRLIAVHNDIYEGTSRAFDDRRVALLMIAACIHDVGHDGKSNTLKGVHHPGRLEMRSFLIARSYFSALGMGEASLAALKVMLMATDVSPLGDPANPMNQMKAAYRFHFLRARKDLESLNLDADLALLEKEPALAMMSLILHEADISTSAGLDYEVTKFETAIYGEEIGEPEARPQHVIEFLNNVCRRGMMSDAGQKLYAANMARIIVLSEDDAANGDQPFPKAQYADFILPGSGREVPKTIN